MNDECPEGDYLLLMVTTVYASRRHDPACILDAGDHPFLTHESYVVYRLANRSNARHVRRMLEKKVYLTKEDFGGPVFTRIAAGIFASDDCPAWAQKYATARGLD